MLAQMGQAGQHGSQYLGLEQNQDGNQANASLSEGHEDQTWMAEAESRNYGNTTIEGHPQGRWQ